MKIIMWNKPLNSRFTPVNPSITSTNAPSPGLLAVPKEKERVETIATDSYLKNCL